VDGMSEVLRTLNVDYRSAIISSSINNPIKKYLNKFQLDGIFEEIYGAEFSLSKEVKIKVALEKFQITGDEAVFITDTLGDMREAAKVGVKSIGVTWGFQKESNLKKGNPVAIVNTPEELLATIESLG